MPLAGGKPGVVARLTKHIKPNQKKNVASRNSILTTVENGDISHAGIQARPLSRPNIDVPQETEHER